VIRRDAEQAGARFVLKPTDCASVSALLLPQMGEVSKTQALDFD
jgi:hypothetical protein